jgi:adenine-specific DNA methylase
VSGTEISETSMRENSEIALKSLIEEWIPVEEISRDAAIEMSFKPTPAYVARCKELKLSHSSRNFYDPKIRSLHPWLARRARSVARALNLAALLPPDINVDDFLCYLGFTREKLNDAISNGYPPLISYLPPELPTNIQRNVIILDPMAGGGSIPLESAILGINTIACDYNPVSYLLLRGTIEFPAKYGIELWKRLTKEVETLSAYIIRELSPYYKKGIEGYIILRQVKLNGKIIPLQRRIPLSRNICVKVDEDGAVSLTEINEGIPTKRELLNLWMNQHVNVMTINSEFYGVVHRLIAIQTSKGFRLAENSDIELLKRSYADYFSKGYFLSLPKVRIPRDNEVFSDISPIGYYHLLFNARQALALHFLISYVRDRVRELVENEGEFGAALGLYLAFGVDRIIDFNSILTTWNYNTLTIRDASGSYYKYRKFRLEGNYAEAIIPYRTIDWVYEPEGRGKTAGGICPVVKELAEKLEGKDRRVDIYMCDVMKLSQYFRKIADVINVDPPYYDQHVYSDFSEFFWPFLKTMLEPAIPHLFSKKVLIDWNPDNWSVPKSNEVIARKGDKRVFETRLKAALNEMKAALKDDGLLIFWFSHRSMDAWKAAVQALSEAGFSITAIIPLPSEHPTRSITRGGRAGINRVLMIVARKMESVGERDKADILRKFKEYILQAKLYPGEVISKEEIQLLTEAATYALSKC